MFVFIIAVKPHFQRYFTAFTGTIFFLFDILFFRFFCLFVCLFSLFGCTLQHVGSSPMRTEPAPSALEMWSLHQWHAREIHSYLILLKIARVT